MFTIREYKELIASLNEQIIDYRNKNRKAKPNKKYTEHMNKLHAEMLYYRHKLSDLNSQA